MMRVSVASAFRPAWALPSPAGPLLDPTGARVVLGDHVAGNGLPVPIAPGPSTLFGPRGICFARSDGPFLVADTGHHRLLGWRQVPQTDNAPADFVIGQPDFCTEGCNAKRALGPATLNMPTGIASDGQRLAVADAWNHRVLIWRSLPERSNQPPDLVLGQPDFSCGLANRGGRLAGPDTLNWCYGVTISDGRLFVADTGNRRVLVWNSVPERSGQPADLVLGQPDMIAHDDNAGTGASAVGMRWPHAVAVVNGRILVADAGNSRVMAWNGMPNADGAPASFILGQKRFEELDHNRAAYDPTERALQMPYGIAVRDGTLICADTANSRLVGFPLDGMDMDAPATTLAGQNGFGAKGDNRWKAATRDSLCWPFAVAVCGDLVAVADTGNNRVLLWEAAP
ncbi:NHL repeat-containing protein [Mesorhizobium sp. VK25A]|uniref:NHL repeat-containing protein n=1 Tax=Mesorhizobium vachelliae TaxID=3072309 RepID=A0ABU5A6B4_9HYPH|nr:MULTISPECIES: NHL repeat-containing protein [unclassified Mesorhizobium]MDX8533117.1 NHL repeat-containing protein [Mesorhizobium sp. VK25D]MDX8545036.1 NHL repeat-containing protein [Mesorhizobium sp. VK25A]